jgi:hypothetical protein
MEAARPEPMRMTDAGGAIVERPCKWGLTSGSARRQLEGGKFFSPCARARRVRAGVGATRGGSASARILRSPTVSHSRHSTADLFAHATLPRQMATLPSNHSLWFLHGLDESGTPVKKAKAPTEHKYKIISAQKTTIIDGDLHYIFVHEDTGEFAYRYSSSTIDDFWKLNDALRTHHQKKEKKVKVRAYPVQEHTSGNIPRETYLGNIPQKHTSETYLGNIPREHTSETYLGIPRKHTSEYLGNIPREHTSGTYLGNIPRKHTSETYLGNIPRKHTSETYT